MNSKIDAIEISEFAPPVAGANVDPARSRRKFARVYLGIVVLALHALVLALFAIPALRVGDPTAEARLDRGRMVMVDIVSPTPDEPLTAATAEPVLDRVVLEPPLLDFANASDDVSEPARSIEFRPPVMKHGSTEPPEVHALRAGVELKKSARTILVVNITEEGKAAEVQVLVSSGNDGLDAVAIEYARALDWLPAVVRGRNKSMSIRLPVVFAANS